MCGSLSFMYESEKYWYRLVCKDIVQMWKSHPDWDTLCESYILKIWSRCEVHINQELRCESHILTLTFHCESYKPTSNCIIDINDYLSHCIGYYYSLPTFYYEVIMKILFSYTSQTVFRVAKNINLTQCAHIDMFNSVQLLCTSDY